MISKNGTKDGIVELGGSEFRRVKNGLDETQVASFISKLISQRDMLTEHEEHLSSLTRLAEKMVTEADKLAQEIKTEALEQASAEATAVIAKAEEQTQQMIKEKRAEIITAANEKAAAIKAEAEREAELLLENERNRIKPELRELTHQLYSQLLSELEGLKHHMAALEKECEYKLSQLAEQPATPTMTQELPSAQIPATIQQEENITPDISSEVSLESADDADAESRELIQAMAPTNTSEPQEEAPIPADSLDMATYKEIELEILPPIDVMKIMGIITHLDGLSEVGNTELIPLADKPSIIVFLREPVHLVDILRILPEVEQVKEVTPETPVTGAADAEGKRRKIQITLSGKPGLEETKEKLNGDLSNIISS